MLLKAQGYEKLITALFPEVRFRFRASLPTSTRLIRATDTSWLTPYLASASRSSLHVAPSSRLHRAHTSRRSCKRSRTPKRP
jgi:hypothetical protein